MSSHLLRVVRGAAVAGLFSTVAATPAEAQNFILDFTPAPLSGVFTTEGSVPGVVDVRYRHRSGWGLSPITDNQGHYWFANYNDLLDVLYTQSGAGVGEVFLYNLVAGDVVIINSADVGAWSHVTRTVELRVYDLAGTLLYQQTGNTVGSTTHASFAPGDFDLDGLLVQWSGVDAQGNPVDAYNVGIDN